MVYSPDVGVVTSDNRCNESGVFTVKKWDGFWLKFTLGKALLFSYFLNHFYGYTVLSIGPTDFLVGPFIKFGSLRHRCLNVPLNKGWVLPDAPFRTGVYCWTLFVPRGVIFPRVFFFPQDRYFSLRYPCPVLRAH
jgi:hypothetical protein